MLALRLLKPKEIALLPLPSTLLLGLTASLFLGCKPSMPDRQVSPGSPQAIPLAVPHKLPDETHEESQSQSAPMPSSRKALVIEVLGFDSQQGRARLALYRSPEGFNQPEKAWAKETLEIPNQGPLVWTLEIDEEALHDPQVRWAVSAHHDKNSNDKLDKSALGIPTEPYGFSNNPKRGFGPPKFDEVSFSIDSNDPKSTPRIEIKIH